MSIDSHIEDAMKHLGKKYGGDGPDSRDIFRSVIGSAIDEATAPLRQRIAELEGLGPLIEEFGADCACAEGWRDSDWSRRYKQACDERDATVDKIRAILKGGAK